MLKVLILVTFAVLANCQLRTIGDDSLSQPNPYQYSYNAPTGDGGYHTKSETGDGYGRVQGSYEVNESDGRSRLVQYVADEGGFRAAVSTNEPGTANQSPADVNFRSSADDGPSAPARLTIVAPEPRSPLTVIPAPRLAPLTLVRAPEPQPITILRAPEPQPFTILRAPQPQQFTFLRAPEPQRLTVVRAPEPQRLTVVRAPEQPRITVVPAGEPQPIALVRLEEPRSAPLTLVRAPEPRVVFAPARPLQPLPPNEIPPPRPNRLAEVVFLRQTEPQRFALPDLRIPAQSLQLGNFNNVIPFGDNSRILAVLRSK